jgi:sulfite reductase alpha subunit-like flavoprotein
MLFALGDLTYKHYCGFGKNVNKKLLELGASNVQQEIGTGSNDQNKIGDFFNDWKTGIWNDILENAPANPDFTGGNLPVSGAGLAPKFIVQVGSKNRPVDVNTLKDSEGFEVNTSVGQDNEEILQVL